MKRNRAQSRRCAFESLENRTMLAGDVTARIDHGNLIIKGDDFANGITIVAGTTAGQVVITGVNAGGSSTNVNGTANGVVTLSGFTGGLKIEMKDGDDSVSITNLTVSGSAKIKMGKGNDTLTLTGSNFSALNLDLGKDSDTLSLSDVDVSGKGWVRGRRGDDDITIASSTFEKLDLTMSKGDDSLSITGTTVSDKTRLKGGQGTNEITGNSSNSLADLKSEKFTGDTTTGAGPTLAISGASTVNEATAYSLNLSSTGTGADTITKWTIIWGDGTAAQDITGDPTTATHTFADGPNTYSISATATNADGTFAAGNKVVVTVGNVAPVLALSGPASVSAGAIYTLGLSSTDVGADTITSWTINWGDGSAAQVVTGDPASVTHTFTTASNSYTITAMAKDEDNTYTAGNSIVVSVTSGTPPTLSLTGGTSVNEGSPYTLTLAATGTGASTISQWTIDWGDGTTPQVVTGNPTSVTHTFADGPHNYTISGMATNPTGTYAAGNTVAVTVNDVDPTLVISGPASATIGSAYTLLLSSSDPGTDTITSWMISWGDGSSPQTVTGNPSSVTHTYTTAGNVTIAAIATNEDNQFNANTVAVTVAAAVAAPAISGAASTNEGAAYTLTLTPPAGVTVTQWTITWGDGSAAQVVTGSPATVPHTFADGPNNFTISATATTGSGTVPAGNTIAVNVKDVVPTLVFTGPETTFEGTLTNWAISTPVDPGTDTITQIVVNWGDGNSSMFTPDQLTANGNSAGHSYADGANSYTISVDIIDDDGTHAGVATLPVTVSNLPPSLTVTPPTTVTTGVAANFTLGATSDPGSDTVTSYVIHWGDGNTSTFTAAEIATMTRVVPHTYATANTFTISVDLTDEDGTFTDVGGVSVTVTAPV